MLESLFYSEYCKTFKSTILKNICEWLLLKMCSWNWEKLEIIHKDFQKRVNMFVFISWLVSYEVCIHTQNFFGVVKNKLQALISTRVNQNKIKSSRKEICIKINKSCERNLNFDQWKTFSENYKPMRVSLWFVYKFTENYCRLQLSSEFIQTQKSFPTSLDKMRILNWKLLVISS